MVGITFGIYCFVAYIIECCCLQVNETVKVHCGFYSENGGFAMSDEDKSYMRTCEIVVSTCAFGGGDDLYQPIGMVESSLKKVRQSQLRKLTHILVLSCVFTLVRSFLCNKL